MSFKRFGDYRKDLNRPIVIPIVRRVRLTSGIFMGEFVEANNVHEDVCYRKTLKPLTQILTPEGEFPRPPKANYSDRLSIKKTLDNIIHIRE